MRYPGAFPGSRRVDTGPQQIGMEHHIHWVRWRVLACGKNRQKRKQEQAQHSHERPGCCPTQFWRVLRWENRGHVLP